MESKKDRLLFPKLQLANSNMQLKKIKVDHCKVRRKLKCNFETVSHSFIEIKFHTVHSFKKLSSHIVI